MIERGWIEEIDADIRKREPFWRETGDGHGTTLIATEAGLDAIGIESLVVGAVIAIRKARAEAGTAPEPVTIRAGTKQAQIIALLQKPQGASIAEIVEATGWMAHSARGLISGALKKKLGLPVTSEKTKKRGTVYKLIAARGLLEFVSPITPSSKAAPSSY